MFHGRDNVPIDDVDMSGYIHDCYKKLLSGSKEHYL